MKSWIKKSLLSLSTFTFGVGVMVLPFIIFIKPTNELVFGNFNSYISDDVKVEITNEFNIKWQYYGSNAEIPTFIQNKTLDVAIATNNTIAKLANNNEIQPIPWDKFNLKKQDGTTIKNYKDLKGFVTDATWALCEIAGKSLNMDNILEYSVPYFMQNFVFAYRGEKINSLIDTASFKDIFDYISQNKKFTSKNSSVMMIQDARSVYNVSRIIQGLNINPHYNEISINSINDSYDFIANYYKNKNKNIITFNPDSSIVLNKVALNESNGAFMYNGDAIYAALGGDNISENKNLPSFEDPQNYHVIIPENNFFAMDGIIINKNVSGKKLDKSIEVIKKLALSGMNYGEDISKKIDNKFFYTSTENFNFVNYTPCYVKLYDYAIDTSPNGYFYNQSETKLDSEINLLTNLLKIDSKNIKESNVESQISELFNSNLNIAFIEFKNRL